MYIAIIIFVRFTIVFCKVQDRNLRVDFVHQAEENGRDMILLRLMYMCKVQFHNVLFIQCS